LILQNYRNFFKYPTKIEENHHILLFYGITDTKKVLFFAQTTHKCANKSKFFLKIFA